MKRHGYQPKRIGKTPRTPPSGGPTYSIHYVDALKRGAIPVLGTPKKEVGLAEELLRDFAPPESQPDLVNAPPHYRAGDTYETIRVIEAWGLDFCLGNVLKYVSRAGKKATATELQDLRKGLWYLQRRIEQLEKKP